MIASLTFSLISIKESKEKIFEAWRKVREKAIGLLNKVEELSAELEESKAENQRLKDYIASQIAYGNGSKMANSVVKGAIDY